MNKIKLTITGCLGRMGQQLVKSSKNSKNFKLVSLTENRIINKKISGLRPQLNSVSAFKNANVIIDFTIPKCALEVLKIASKLKKRVVIGTTGLSKKEENLIKKYSKKMIHTISRICEINPNQINIKGKTTEKLGLIGKEKAIASEVISSVMKYD